MGSAAINRLESLLQARKLDRTVTRLDHELARPRSSSGIGPLDEALGGGWPRGEVSELVGRRSTGRTTVLHATLAAATGQGEIAAVIDTFDRFDPLSAAAAGVDLERVLWVRGLSLSLEMTSAATKTTSLGHAVRRAIRALDLVLRAGGFAVAALDLADVPARYLQALPFTTWMRLAHVNEGRPTSCVLLGQAPIGRSARGASVQLDASARWPGDSVQRRRFGGFDVRARVHQANRTVDLAWTS